MGKAPPHRLTRDVVTLGRALRPSERSAVGHVLRELLAWQRTLGKWPRSRAVPDATPYVSLYAHGELRGCYGSHEGSPFERLARAFVLALGDTRYGGVAQSERGELAASVSYLTRSRLVRADQAPAVIEPGVHAAALVDGTRAVVLLPSVARERGYDAEGFLDVLARKAAQPRSSEGIVWLLDTDEVSSQDVKEDDPQRAAKRFLESLVGRDGSVGFDVHPGTGRLRASGVMRHGRIAVAVEALAFLGSTKTRAARAWLGKELKRGLDKHGASIEGWPERPDMLLGTLALAVHAGLDVPLVDLASAVDEKTCSPWHAAQVASALGKRTPSELWSHCIRDLDAHPLAPYTLLAARAREDAPIVERCARALAEAIRKKAPFMGGAAFTPVPETALTAAAVEALSGLPGREVRHSLRAARAFIAARQVLDVPASMHPSTLGAFRASPIAPILRCDVTAHAVLASKEAFRA